MSDLECPYCGHYQDKSDDCYETEVRHEHQCEECESLFQYEIEYNPVCTSYPTPCLNGGEHKWVKVHGAPKELFEGVKRCKYCAEQTPLNTENYKKAMELQPK